jgi:hypothetical protein
MLPPILKQHKSPPQSAHQTLYVHRFHVPHAEQFAFQEDSAHQGRSVHTKPATPRFKQVTSPWEQVHRSIMKHSSGREGSAPGLRPAKRVRFDE